VDALKPYFADPRVAALGNLVMGLFVLAWTLGVPASRRNTIAWRGWVAFWCGTSAFYAIHTLDPDWDGVPFAALYVATWSLLAAYFVDPFRGRTGRAAAGALIIVVPAILADVVMHAYGHEPGVHQTLTAAVLVAWAWRIRGDASKSVPLIVYAVVQLPVASIYAFLHGFATPANTGAAPRSDPGALNPADYSQFVAATYVAYLLLKVTLIPSVVLAVTAQTPKEAAS